MQRLLIFLTIALSFSSCKSAVTSEHSPTVYQTGDNSLWAEKNFNDSSWSTKRGNTDQQIFWARSVVKFIKTPSASIGLQIEAFGAFELYWDGVLIGHNGQITQKNKPEQPGTATSFFQIPSALADTGRHIVALRITQSYLNGVKRPIGIKPDIYADLLRRPLILISFMNLMAGAFLTAAIYYFFLFLNSRRKEYSVLIFAFICLLFFCAANYRIH